MRRLLLGLLALTLLPAVFAAPPVINLSITENQTFNDHTIALEVTADQNISAWWYVLDQGTNTTFTPNTTITGLANGNHNITVYANNSNGEIGHTDAYQAPAIEWNWTLGGNGFDSLSTTPVSEGYMLTGFTSSFGVQVYDWWVVKVDDDWNQEWNLTFGKDSVDASGGLLEDNGYLVEGYVIDSGLGTTDGAILKINSSGGIVWNKTYGYPGDDSISQISKIENNTYFVVGYTDTNTRGGFDFWFLKMNGSGDIQWNRTMGGSDDDSPQQLFPNENGYFLTGSTKSFGAGAHDIWYVWIDENGTQLRNTTYGGTSDDYPAQTIFTTEGNIVTVGRTKSFGAGDWDGWLIATDENGTQLWNQTYGDANNNRLFSIIEEFDGYTLLGITQSGTYNDIWALKVNKTGGEIWNQTYGGADNEETYGGILIDGNIHVSGTTNSSGNTDAWHFRLSSDRNPVTFSVNDTTPPVITMTSPADGATYTSSTTVPLQVSADETVTLWQYSIDNGARVTFTPNTELELDNGAHTITVYATDTSGNVGTTNYEDNWPPKVLWNKTYGTSSIELLNDMILAHEGGFLLKGYQQTSGPTNRNALLIKVDMDGNEEWNRTYGSSGEEALQAIITTIDPTEESYLIGSYTDQYAADLDAWLIKISRNGTPIWNYTYGSAGDQWINALTKSDTKYVAAGVTNSSDAWVFATDENGSILWNKTFGGAGNDWPYSIINVSDGYMFVGSSNSFDGGDWSVWVLKIDENGTEQWNNTYGGSQDESPHQILPLNDGTFLISARTNSFGEGKYDGWIFTIDENGTMLWNNTYGGLEDDFMFGVSAENDGSYIFTGRTNSFGLSSHDLWLTKISENGTEIWSTTIGGSGWEIGYGLITLNNIIYVMGYTSTTEPNGDGWLLKIGKDSGAISFSVDYEAPSSPGGGSAPWPDALAEFEAEKDESDEGDQGEDNDDQGDGGASGGSSGSRSDALEDSLASGSENGEGSENDLLSEGTRESVEQLTKEEIEHKSNGIFFWLLGITILILIGIYLWWNKK